MADSRPIVALVASPLQFASLRLSSIDQKKVRIIGHRGMSGDVTWPRSALNDPRFLIEFEKFLNRDGIEVFLPNSLNAIYYLCVSHPRVARISYVDEGRLTHRAIEYQHRNPSHWAGRLYRAGFSAARQLPSRLQLAAYRALCILVRLSIIQPYVSDTANYSYRTLERRWKSGRILCHIPIQTQLPDVEYVNLLKDLNFPRDSTDAACLFLHPKGIDDYETLRRLVVKILDVRSQFQCLLIKPHPIFINNFGKLHTLTAKLDENGIPWRIVEVSGTQEVTVELYARGVRIFLLPSSTVEDTINAMPDYFDELKCIRY